MLIVEIAKANANADTDVDAEAAASGFTAKGLASKFSKTTPPGHKRALAGHSTLELKRGARVQRYTLLYQLGEGGMGSVHAAFDPKLDRRVALKFLRTDLIGATKQGHRERLVREARALARLSHPNVVSIYDVAETDGSVFLAMELIDGSNARMWRELGTRSIDDVVKVYREALSALLAAHDQGIIHRDFKPDNVMIGTDGTARVTDFGLARAAMVDVDELLAAADSNSVSWDTLTQTGLVLGTPRYMAPEQFSGIANESTDQFSFCLSLYEALYGHYPLGTKTPRSLEAHRDISEQILSPLTKGKVPDALRRVLLRGMAVNPSDRWPSLRELQYELSLVLNPDRSALRWAAVGGLTALVIGGAFLLAPDSPPRTLHEDRDYVAELQSLRLELKKRVGLNDELDETRRDNRKLKQRIIDIERAVATAQLKEEIELEAQAVRPRRVRTPNPLPVTSIDRAVNRRQSEVLACYENYISVDDEVTVSAKLGIAATGIVEWVTPPMGGVRGANRCLARVLERITLPGAEGATTATLHLSLLRLPESGLPTLNLRSKTRHAELGEVTIDSEGRVLVDCDPSDALCGL